MARCDEGYLCEVCGEDVAELVDSDLYLRYVIGMIDPEVLHTTPERHIHCNPNLAQFIVDSRFPPGPAASFPKHTLDAEFVRSRERLVTRGWQRLVELGQIKEGLSLLEYPLPEFAARQAPRPPGDGGSAGASPSP